MELVRAKIKVCLPMGEGKEMVVTVKELTVTEIRNWIVESSAATWRDPVLATVWEDIGLDELARMTDCSATDLEDFTPSGLQPVLEAARNLNQHFFRLRSYLLWADSTSAQENLSTKSTEQSVPS